jgi:hypothetical protein
MAMADIDSILKSIKSLLSLDPADTSFDLPIIIHINSAFSTLTQIGVGPEGGYSIHNDSAVWTDFLGSKTNIDNVKTYMYYRVKLMFDPPPTSFALDAIDKQIKELEYRLLISEGGTAAAAGPIPGRASIWDLTGLDDFPVEAPIGAVGIDLISNNIYRKT